MAAIAAALGIGTAATGEIITVLDPDRTIISHGDVAIPVFSPTLDLTFGTPNQVNDVLNSINVLLNFFPGDNPTGMVEANYLPTTESNPPRSPSIFAFGSHALEIEGFTLRADHGIEDGAWIIPKYDDVEGDWETARLLGNGSLGLTEFPGGSGFIGFANSELTQFGYVQIFRTGLRDGDYQEWELVGWRYGSEGESILVENLIPAPASAGVLAASTLLIGHARRGGNS